MKNNGRRILVAAWPHRSSSWAFLSPLKLKLDSFAFTQAVKVHLLQTAAMEEYFLPVSRPNESKSAVPD
jgi:hypothetical protein